MVLVQKWPFFDLLFLGKIGHENVFYDILERKNASLGYKNKKFKKSKNWRFSKGINHGFGPEMAIFPTFFFFYRQYRRGKCLLRYSRTKQHLLGYKKEKFEKSKNSHFFEGVNLWFWSKNGRFSIFFLRQYRPGKCLLRYSRTKNAFLDYKKKQYQMSKNWHFFKGVNPWFWSKNGRFSDFFFLGKISQENVFYDILEQKNAFVDYKKKSSKSRKIDIFSKGLIHGFGPKIAIFRPFCF